MDDLPQNATREDIVAAKIKARLKAKLQERKRHGFYDAKVAVMYPPPPQSPTREQSIDIANRVISDPEFTEQRAEVRVAAGHVGCHVVLADKDKDPSD
jgi:hypothetical protein